jgi:methyl-accepting chemotaxis protein
MITDSTRKFAVGDNSIDASKAGEAAIIRARSDEIGEIANAFEELRAYLDRKVAEARSIADGDLTVDIAVASEDDRLGNDFLKMSQSLQMLISQVNRGSIQIDAGSHQVSDASQSLSQGATESAASLEQITSSLTEVSSQTKTNAENAGQANMLSSTARDSAQKGSEQMQNMVTAMQDINKSSEDITKIIKVIDDIAFQTNLLALNAAVEAARAGRHGKGFAVVAEEVRNLAARSAKAAKETSELIADSVNKVENGMTIASSTSSALVEILDSTTKAADLVGEIAAASNEQATAIAEVNQGLGQIDSVTQQNTANAEETASAAEELSSQATELRGLLTRFRLKDDGGDSVQPQRAPSQAPILQKTNQGKGWGSASGAKVVNPGQVIALDDKEFGRY